MKIRSNESQVLVLAKMQVDFFNHCKITAWLSLMWPVMGSTAPGTVSVSIRNFDFLPLYQVLEWLFLVELHTVFTVMIHFLVISHPHQGDLHSKEIHFIKTWTSTLL